jgi:hypothetical protein
MGVALVLIIYFLLLKLFCKTTQPERGLTGEIEFKNKYFMKRLSIEKIEKIEGGSCGVASQVVLAFWASGVGYAFGAVSGGVGFLVGAAASIIVIAACEADV